MTRTSSIQKQADQFEELRTCWALVGEGSDEGRGPFTIDEAWPMLDMLDTQAGGDGTSGRSWFDHERAWSREAAAGLDLTDETIEEVQRWNTFVRACATLRTLFAHAVKLARRDPAMRWAKDAFKQTTAAWLKHGFRQVYADGDRHYHCLFCDENLATFGGGSRTVSDQWMRDRERHIEPCAMRYLIRTYNL